MLGNAGRPAAGRHPSVPAPGEARAAWVGGFVGGALAAIAANDRITVGLLEAVVLLLAAVLVDRVGGRPSGRNA